MINFIFLKIFVIIILVNEKGNIIMKNWYVSYTILTMVEGENFEEAKAAAEKFAEDENFYHLINDLEVDKVEE